MRALQANVRERNHLRVISMKMHCAISFLWFWNSRRNCLSMLDIRDICALPLSRKRRGTSNRRTRKIGRKLYRNFQRKAGISLYGMKILQYFLLCTRYRRGYSVLYKSSECLFHGTDDRWGKVSRSCVTLTERRELLIFLAQCSIRVVQSMIRMYSSFSSRCRSSDLDRVYQLTSDARKARCQSPTAAGMLFTFDQKFTRETVRRCFLTSLHW